MAIDCPSQLGRRRTLECGKNTDKTLGSCRCSSQGAGGWRLKFNNWVCVMRLRHSPTCWFNKNHVAYVSNPRTANKSCTSVTTYMSLESSSHHLCLHCSVLVECPTVVKTSLRRYMVRLSFVPSRLMPLLTAIQFDSPHQHGLEHGCHVTYSMCVPLSSRFVSSLTMHPAQCPSCSLPRHITKSCMGRRANMSFESGTTAAAVRSHCVQTPSASSRSRVMRRVAMWYVYSLST